MTYTADEKRWRAAVLNIECCVLCGRYGTEWAHRNEGKGMGLKVAPHLTAALCRTCHEEIDNGKTMARDQRRSEMNEAIVRTLDQLVRNGWLELKGRAA